MPPAPEVNQQLIISFLPYGIRSTHEINYLRPDVIGSGDCAFKLLEDLMHSPAKRVNIIIPGTIYPVAGLLPNIPVRLCQFFISFSESSPVRTFPVSAADIFPDSPVMIKYPKNKILNTSFPDISSVICKACGNIQYLPA